ncbi:MAG: hypothetical protein WBV81_23335 [Ignavibacteriaceae bacterium]
MKISMKSLCLMFCIFQFTLFAQISQKEISVLKSLSKGSDVIATGKVTKQKSSWNKNKTRIYTEATLQVDEYLKGNNNGNTVTVTYPGGEVGSVGEIYSHMPKFVNNEDVLVFLKKDKVGKNYKVFKGEDGKINITKDSKTGEKATSSDVRINFLKAQIKSYLKAQ